jgi:hypothetical protein
MKRIEVIHTFCDPEDSEPVHWIMEIITTSAEYRGRIVHLGEQDLRMIAALILARVKRGKVIGTEGEKIEPTNIQSLELLRTRVLDTGYRIEGSKMLQVMQQECCSAFHLYSLM